MNEILRRHREEAELVAAGGASVVGLSLARRITDALRLAGLLREEAG